MNPYTDDGQVRTFSADTSPESLVWHRDREDRVVTILEGNGWGFQYDDALPFSLAPGDRLTIPKESYHRLLKGYGELKISIQRL